MATSLTGTKGGNGVWQRIISEIPPHRCFIEPFWGRGTISRKKKPCDLTIACDRDGEAIADAVEFGAMAFLCDGIQWLRGFFGIREQIVPAQTFQSLLRVLPSECFVYLDPPYLHHGEKYYKHWLDEQDHRELCRLFRKLPCRAALSGYRTELHAAELGDARAIDIPTVNRAGNAVIETVWFNYDPPPVLHDCRFVGRDRRERERIAKRVKNWSEGLLSMQPAERQAVFEACQAAMVR